MEKTKKTTVFVRILRIVGRSASTEKRSLSNQITIRNMALQIKRKKKSQVTHSYVEKKHYMVSVEVFFFVVFFFELGIGSRSPLSLWQRIVAYEEPHTHSQTPSRSGCGKKKVEQIRQEDIESQEKETAAAHVFVSCVHVLLSYININIYIDSV